MNKDYQVGLYLRLSREDGAEESQSISSQREYLMAYIKKQGWTLYDEYVDDGFSGTNFHRPSFIRLTEDIERGGVNLVLVKDLSRFGRNYVHMGRLLEEYFPEKGVRFVAVNDGYDIKLRLGLKSFLNC